MAIDPIMLALCKGSNSAGEAGLPYINLTTPIVPFADPVRLTEDESIALHKASCSSCPACVFTTIEGVGVFCSVYSSTPGYMFFGCIIVGESVLTVSLEPTTEEFLRMGTGYKYWTAQVSGGMLNPIE